MLRLAAITQINDLRRTKGNIQDIPHNDGGAITLNSQGRPKAKCGRVMQVRGE